MIDSSDGGGCLNRESRRALAKHMKSATNALFNISREPTSESLINRANKILEGNDKPFNLQLSNIEINILANAVYLVCKKSKTTLDIVHKIEDEFFTDMGVETIEYLKQNDTDISEENLKTIMYYAEKSENIEGYLKVYKMCQLSKGTAMETCLRAALSVALYRLMERAERFEKDNKKKNIPLAIKHDTKYSFKSEPTEFRFELVNMIIMLYWMHKVGLSDGSVIRVELGIDLACELSAIINKNVPESTSYEKWIKGDISFENAMMECGDIQEIDSSRIQYYLGLSKGLRATLVESSLVCKSTQKMVAELNKYKENEVGLLDKLQDSKKLRAELQKEVKSVKKQLSEMEKRNSKLKNDVVLAEKKEKGNSKLEAEIEQLKVEVAKLTDEVAKQEIDNLNKDKELAEIREITEVNSRKLNMTINLYEDAQRYIEDLTGKGEIDYEVPIDIVISQIANKRIVILGGRETLESNMTKAGLNSIRHFSVGKIPTMKEIGLFDCLVIITQQVAHKSIMKIRQFAKDTGKPVVYFNGSNIENMCREIFSKIQ